MLLEVAREKRDSNSGRPQQVQTKVFRQASEVLITPNCADKSFRQKSDIPIMTTTNNESEAANRMKVLSQKTHSAAVRKMREQKKRARRQQQKEKLRKEKSWL